MEYNPEETLKQIEEYRRMGFCVIPAEYGGRKPIIEWKEFQEHKPTDEEIKKWFTKPANVNIVCGKISGNLVVLDFESPEYCKEFFPNGDIEQETFSVKTNKGIHIYLLSDKPIKSGKIPEIVDIQSCGRLVTAPPSKHYKGTKYEIINKPEKIGAIKKQDFERIFWNQAEKLGYYKKKGMHTEYGAIKKLPDGVPPCIIKLMQGVTEGGRNNIGFVIATYFKNQGKSQEEILKQLTAWNKRNNPPLDFEEIKATAESVMKSTYGIGCNNPYLKKNCSSKAGDCIFQDIEYLVTENTEKVVEYKPKVDSDITRYRITIMKKTIELYSDKMLTPTIFKQRWLEKHGKLLNIKNDAWHRIVNKWMDNVEDGDGDEISTEQDVVDKIISEIQSGDITTKKELCLNQSGYVYVESIPKEDQWTKLYYPNRHVREIIAFLNVKMDLRRLRELLSDYVAEHTKVLRVSGKTERFWVFDSRKFKIDWSKQVVDEEDVTILSEF